MKCVLHVLHASCVHGRWYVAAFFCLGCWRCHVLCLCLAAVTHEMEQERVDFNWKRYACTYILSMCSLCNVSVVCVTFLLHVFVENGWMVSGQSSTWGISAPLTYKCNYKMQHWERMSDNLRLCLSGGIVVIPLITTPTKTTADSCPFWMVIQWSQTPIPRIWF